MLKLVCFALLVSAVAAGNIVSESCGGTATSRSAAIEGCSGSGACTVGKGKATPVVISFTTASQITSGTYTITASYLGLSIKITEKSLSEGMSLPIAAGSTAKHTHTLTLSSSILSVTAPATLMITDQTKATVLCEKVTMKIVD